MKAIKQIAISAVFICLTSCANKPIETASQPNIDETINKTDPSSELIYSDSTTPPETFEKGSKQLRLVRMMEGGACKTDQQGAKGVFLIYSDPDDIDRIMDEQGSEIFSSFEKEIQDFSLVALDKAVKSTEITVDTTAADEADEADEADAQSKVFTRLARSFRLFVDEEIAKFQQKTTLTVAIIPFKSAFEFYTNNCEATHLH